MGLIKPTGNNDNASNFHCSTNLSLVNTTNYSPNNEDGRHVCIANGVPNSDGEYESAFTSVPEIAKYNSISFYIFSEKEINILNIISNGSPLTFNGVMNTSKGTYKTADGTNITYKYKTLVTIANASPSVTNANYFKVFYEELEE